jgi:hypothetical protein
MATADFEKINKTTEDILDDLENLFSTLHGAYEVPRESLLDTDLLRTLRRRLGSINRIRSQRCPICMAPAPAVDGGLIQATDFERMTSVITDRTDETIAVLPPERWVPGLALANHYDPEPCPIRTPVIGRDCFNHAEQPFCAHALAGYLDCFCSALKKLATVRADISWRLEDSGKTLELDDDAFVTNFTNTLTCIDDAREELINSIKYLTRCPILACRSIIVDYDEATSPTTWTPRFHATVECAAFSQLTETLRRNDPINYQRIGRFDPATYRWINEQFLRDIVACSDLERQKKSVQTVTGKRSASDEGVTPHVIDLETMTTTSTTTTASIGIKTEPTDDSDIASPFPQAEEEEEEEEDGVDSPLELDELCSFANAEAEEASVEEAEAETEEKEDDFLLATRSTTTTTTKTTRSASVEEVRRGLRGLFKQFRGMVLIHGRSHGFFDDLPTYRRIDRLFNEFAQRTSDLLEEAVYDEDEDEDEGDEDEDEERLTHKRKRGIDGGAIAGRTRSKSRKRQKKDHK